jgi:hypothetical protein
VGRVGRQIEMPLAVLVREENRHCFLLGLPDYFECILASLTLAAVLTPIRSNRAHSTRCNENISRYFQVSSSRRGFPSIK